MSDQIIQISSKGYKTFCLVILLEYDEEYRQFKIFKIINEGDWIENTRSNDKQNDEKGNSNNFTLIDGVNLIVELEKE